MRPEKCTLLSNLWPFSEFQSVTTIVTTFVSEYNGLTWVVPINGNWSLAVWNPSGLFVVS